MLQVFCIARLLQETFIDNTGGGGVPTLILKFKTHWKLILIFLKPTYIYHKPVSVNSPLFKKPA